MTTALITGATSGIGLEFARQLAARHTDLVLVARDRERLDRVAGELAAAYGVRTEVLVADLSDRAQLQAVADRVGDAEQPVDVLINNAGFAVKGSFLATDLADEEAHFDVLARAVLVLTHTAAQAMVARGWGRILNVSSVAGFLASGSYAAAKSYVTVLTESLAADLAGTGVSATAVCPGFVRTEFHQRAGLTMTAVPEIAWIPVEKLVRQALRDGGRGRIVSVPDARYKAIAGLLRVTPRSLARRPQLVRRHRRGQ